ncbi:DUF1178 family protein [Hyphomonas johnsonii]|jgi:hypothetical protein|uniref:Putative regulatory protein FmdB zinc ribbon domain-containing protein n=1 Tax=Hyphomonas johnsonii MHS-2 TaxID=1280950 RepID=A0A059FP48_9PROT|nr:DUF1178 family protein [Hyphomonas johnsonii]KCZ92440.1 hypothetical protein HJO_10404 [Hyphomonas johnsonii MHS-2]
MIRYALICGDCEHLFEAWFAGSEAFDRQVKKRLVTCPDCSGANVSKQIMAPSVRSPKQAAARREASQLAEELARKARDHVARNFDYVGDGFADEARAMYYGEKDDRPIWGETTPEESAALAEEGVPAAPLPRAFTPKVPRTPASKRNLN